MHRTPWTDVHDRLLVDAKPSVPEPSAAEIERVWTQVAGTIEGQNVPRSRRRAASACRHRRRHRCGRAGNLRPRCGRPLHGSHRRRGRWTPRTSASGGRARSWPSRRPTTRTVVAEETTDIPFPSTESREVALQEQVDDARGAQRRRVRHDRGSPRMGGRPGAVRMVEPVGRRDPERRRGRPRRGDRHDPGRSHVARRHGARPRAVQPDGDAGGQRRRGQHHDGALSRREPVLLPGRLGEAVEGREPGAVARVLAANNGYCRAENMPDLPNADPMYARR